MLRTEIEKALAVLKDGGVILYPTDTVWGLGCDATNEQAVAKINEIKGRAADKSFIILLDTDNKLQSYVNEVPDVAYDLIEYAENPLTLVFPGAKNLAKNVINADGSIGIRIAKHDFCQQLIQRFRKPITSTSANVSGAPTPLFFDEISDEIKEAVDYIVDLEQELKTNKKPSTIMKLAPGGQFSFIRR
ncbi:threonylcarbamoyl-AMP synthase [Pedobacter hiemivivus]|jgi:L-threonylcarbamoyladenylate synthase|uniref:L-threonylcarbamoyladenylate synthase n=1 Tax=Pedobacter hiemivivus TaxID=2530454 RepID=A0A4U1GBL1_9SPHI|nr:L-threonylcarbamoyladenylate synthase [Pedobacter hiemivivus]TCC95821.1 threonylcarbamoyl-AMP synthase [Pedobacter hiemivivus]TKC61341.1 threonylcarbamoyl-AMP synthase [Pedobacter hiemivivus]